MNYLTCKITYIALLCCIFCCHIGFSQTGTIDINQDKRINTLLSLKKEINRVALVTDNYKIQVYSGNRKNANEKKKKFDGQFDKWKSSIQYETPNFKVWAGNFKTRLEADRALKIIKTKFDNAFIFKAKN